MDMMRDVSELATAAWFQFRSESHVDRNEKLKFGSGPEPEEPEEPEEPKEPKEPKEPEEPGEHGKQRKQTGKPKKPRKKFQCVVM